MSRPDAQEALIHLMVVMSAADRDMTDAELRRMGNLVRALPVFDGFDEEDIIPAARRCQAMLQKDGGLETILGNVRDIVPQRLHDTAYALAVEIVSADQQVAAEELRLLQIVRNRLSLEPLVAAAIERAVQARLRPLPAAAM